MALPTLPLATASPSPAPLPAVLKFYGALTPLSNFYRAPFVLDGITYSTVEQYFQAKKAEMAGDVETGAKILRSASPSTAKALGRKVKALPVSRWNAEREEVMLTGLRAKFAQCPISAAILRSTGTAVLAENSPRDYYWGIGRSGAGKNRLGFLLMRVRAEME